MSFLIRRWLFGLAGGDSAGRGLQTLRFSVTTEGGREHNQLAAIVLL